MIAPSIKIRRVTDLGAAEISALARILVECVEGGASVSFMPPITLERAAAFWREVGDDITMGSRALLVAEDEAGICGTVQLILNLPENQPHRADLVKMLVAPRLRRQGVGSSLMQVAETTARQLGRSLLVLDAVTDGPGARLYEKLGWVEVGTIPRYALMPNGDFCSTTIYYKPVL